MALIGQFEIVATAPISLEGVHAQSAASPVNNSDEAGVENQGTSAAAAIWAGLPMSGTASEVVGMMAETRFIKTVSERRTVTSERGGRPVPGRKSSISGEQQRAHRSLYVLSTVESCIILNTHNPVMVGLPMGGNVTEVAGMTAKTRFIKKG